MADLYVGLVVLGGLSIALFAGSLWCSYRISQLLSDLLAMLVVALMFFYIRHLWYDVRLTRILPFSNLVVIGNWLPPLAGLLAGFAWRRRHGVRNGGTLPDTRRDDMDGIVSRAEAEDARHALGR